MYKIANLDTTKLGLLRGEAGYSCRYSRSIRRKSQGRGGGEGESVKKSDKNSPCLGKREKMGKKEERKTGDSGKLGRWRLPREEKTGLPITRRTPRQRKNGGKVTRKRGFKEAGTLGRIPAQLHKTIRGGLSVEQVLEGSSV